MIIGIGTDVVDVARFRADLTDGFVAERFLPSETDYCSGRARPWECLAARKAAKQALLNALAGCGVREADGPASGDRDEPWLDIEIARQPSGEVDLRLTGRVFEATEAAGAVAWSLSVSHTKSTALAVVVLESTD